MTAMAALLAKRMSPAAITEEEHSSDTSLHQWNIATQTLCIVFMTLFFGLRVYSRKFVLRVFGAEDWVCGGAWLLGVMYSIIALIMGHFGGGIHIDHVPKESLISFSKTVYVTMVMYGPTAFLTKVSLLWLLARVFSPYKKVVWLIYIFFGIMLGYYVPAVIVKVRICSPIKKFWDPSTPGSCLDEAAIILADSVISVISDLMILLLPLPLTLSLQMPLRKRIRVVGILCAGGLAVAATIVRLVLILRTGASPDATWAFMRINMFGNAEIAIGVICACLPSLSALITNYYHEYSSNQDKYSSQYNMSKTNNTRDGGVCGGGGGTRSRGRMSILEAGSDQDFLMSHVQIEPKVEASGRHDTPPAHHHHHGHKPSLDGIQVTRTVNISTCTEENT